MFTSKKNNSNHLLLEISIFIFLCIWFIHSSPTFNDYFLWSKISKKNKIQIKFKSFTFHRVTIFTFLAHMVLHSSSSINDYFLWSKKCSINILNMN
jgi:hypothetical protein